MQQPDFEILKLEDLIKISPKIAVIGAECPTEEYKNQQGMQIGYGLRKIIQSNQGLVFTGGVNGVGIDVARGVVDYCKENNTPDSRFFVSFPEKIAPAEDYFRYLSELNEKLKIIPSGKDMLERRKKLAELADILIVLNGGTGTLDEAEQAYDLGKPLYCLTSSGGAARDISEHAQEDNLIKSFNSVEDLLTQITTKFHTASHFPNRLQLNSP